MINLRGDEMDPLNDLNHSQAGFTLLEIVMVVGVVALIASSLSAVIITQFDMWKLNVNQSQVTENSELILSYLEKDINQAVDYEFDESTLTLEIDQNRDGTKDKEVAYIHTVDQLWRIDHAEDKEDLAYYKVVAAHSGKVLDVEGDSESDGADVIQYHYKGSTQTGNQKWVFYPLGNGYYKILAQHSDKALTVAGGSVSNGANVIQDQYQGVDHQNWELEKVEGGYYKIIARQSDKVIEVPNGSQVDVASVKQAEYSGADYQHWRLDSLAGAEEDLDVVGNLLRDISFDTINNKLEVKLKLQREDFSRTIKKEFYISENQTSGQNYQLKFDGVDDYVAISSLFYEGNNYSNLTIITKIKTNDSNGKIYDFDANNYFSFALKNGKLAFKVNDGSEIVSTTSINDNNSHIIAVTFGQGTAKLYIDGNLDKTNNGFPTEFGTSNPIRYGFIGTKSEAITFNGSKDINQNNNFAGSLYWLQHWERTLSQQQIQLYSNNSLVGTEADLVSYYPIINQDQLIYDFGHDYHGQISGAEHELVGGN